MKGRGHRRVDGQRKRDAERQPQEHEPKPIAPGFGNTVSAESNRWAPAQPPPVGEYHDSETNQCAEFLEKEKHSDGGRTVIDGWLLQPDNAIDKPSVFVGKGIPEIMGRGAE